MLAERCPEEDVQTDSCFGLKRSTKLLALLFAVFLARTAWADEPKLSISGYDPVAYFTDGKPVQGKPEFEYLWRRLRWRFVSAEHRDLFTRDPNHYAPQYDGYCAMGISEGEAAHKDTVDPEAWAIVDGKLYLTHNRYIMQIWRESATERIRQADPRSSLSARGRYPQPGSRIGLADARCGHGELRQRCRSPRDH